MDNLVTDRFEDSWPEDENPKYDTWICAKCGRESIDPEDYSYDVKDMNIEARLYWLSINEPVCYICAEKSGLPPIDKE